MQWGKLQNVGPHLIIIDLPFHLKTGLLNFQADCCAESVEIFFGKCPQKNMSNIFSSDSLGVLIISSFQVLSQTVRKLGGDYFYKTTGDFKLNLISSPNLLYSWTYICNTSLWR